MAATPTKSRSVRKLLSDSHHQPPTFHENSRLCMQTTESLVEPTAIADLVAEGVARSNWTSRRRERKFESAVPAMLSNAASKRHKTLKSSRAVQAIVLMVWHMTPDDTCTKNHQKKDATCRIYIYCIYIYIYIVFCFVFALSIRLTPRNASIGPSFGC